MHKHESKSSLVFCANAFQMSVNGSHANPSVIDWPSSGMESLCQGVGLCRDGRWTNSDLAAQGS